LGAACWLPWPPATEERAGVAAAWRWRRFGRRRARRRGSAAGRAGAGQPVGQWPAAGAAGEDDATVACSVRDGGGRGRRRRPLELREAVAGGGNGGRRKKEEDARRKKINRYLFVASARALSSVPLRSWRLWSVSVSGRCTTTARVLRNL